MGKKKYGGRRNGQVRNISIPVINKYLILASRKKVVSASLRIAIVMRISRLKMLYTRNSTRKVDLSRRANGRNSGRH